MKAKKLKPSESMRAEYLNNMVKIPSQEFSLMGPIQLNDASAKRADECLNLNRAGGAAKILSNTVDCNKSTFSTVREDGNVDLWMGGKGIDNSKSNSPHIDHWSASSIRVKKEDENTKWNASGWPRWATTSKKSKEGNSTMACKRDWNDSEDVKVNRKASEGGEDAFYLDGVDRCKQSNMVGKEISSNSCWEKKDGNVNKEIDGWPCCGGSVSKTIKDSPIGQNKSTGWNSSLGWTGSDLGDLRKEDGTRNPDLDQSEDPWMQKSTGIPSKCGWNKSARWASSKGSGLDRNSWKRSPGLDQTGCDPWEQHCPNKLPKDCREKWRSSAAPEKSYFRKKREWSGAPRFCNPDASEQHGSRLSSGLNQSGRDPGKQFKRVNWSNSPNCGDRDASNKQERCTYRQKGSTFLPTVGGEKPLSSISKIMSHASDHGSYQSNDRYRVEANISANYRDSPRRTSKRVYGIGDTLCQYSDRDMDGFADSNKAQYLRNDRRMSSENPWQKKDHLQKTHSRRQESYGHGFGKRNFSRMDTSNDGCNYESTGQVSTTNLMKIHNSAARDELRQSHTMIGHCSKLMVDDDTHNSHPACNTQQNYYMSQETPQNTLPHSDVQNDGFTDSAIHLGQNVHINFQLPASPKSFNPKGQIQDHERPVMPNGKPVKESDQNLKFFPSTAVSSSNSVSAASVQDNEGSSSTNLPSRIRSSPVAKKAFKTSEELNLSMTELTPSEQNLNTSTRSAKKLQSGSCDPCHHEPLDDKGIKMFKIALAEFVKKILKPTWKEGGLSLEAHRAVVKNVIDKVIRVLGSNVPRTQAMIDRYMSFANDKLNKLTQDYLEMYINT